MRYFAIVFYLLSTSSIFANEQENIGKIHLYEAPHLVKNTSLEKNSVYGIIDVYYDYEKMYQVYCKNTPELENTHFSKKVQVKQDEEGFHSIYHLIFTHWFVGQLFKMKEEHRKLVDNWWPANLNLGFSKKEKTNIWVVDKSLLKETKSSWVGDNLKTFYAYFGFIDMGKGKTRLYCHMIVDAKGCRTTKEVKNEVVKALEKIVELCEIDEKK